MADLLAMSSAVIEGAEGAAQIGPINRINHQLSEIGRGVAIVEAFSRCGSGNGCIGEQQRR